MEPKTSRRIVGSFLLAIFVVLVIYAAFFVGIPSVSNTIYSPGMVFSPPTSDIPKFSADMTGTVAASGSFSVNNPITLSFVLLTNVTGLTKHYCCLALVDSTRTDVQYIVLQSYSNSSNQYHGSGQFVFPVSGRVYINFVTGVIPFGNFAQPQNRVVLMNISAVGDTYSWQYQRLTTQLTVVLVAFSVVMLQPVIEAVVGIESRQPTPNAASTSTPPASKTASS